MFYLSSITLIVHCFVTVYVTMQPYVDEPDNCGMQITEREKLFKLTMESDKSKLQVFSPSPIIVFDSSK